MGIGVRLGMVQPALEAWRLARRCIQHQWRDVVRIWSSCGQRESSGRGSSCYGHAVVEQTDARSRFGRDRTCRRMRTFFAFTEIFKARRWPWSWLGHGKPSLIYSYTVGRVRVMTLCSFSLCDLYYVPYCTSLVVTGIYHGTRLRGCGDLSEVLPYQ